MNYLTYLPVWDKLDKSQQEKLTNAAVMRKFKKRGDTPQRLCGLHGAFSCAVGAAAGVRGVGGWQGNYSLSAF